jgi:hypothetical protein
MLDQIGLLTAHEVEAVVHAYLMIQQMPRTIEVLAGDTQAPSAEWLKVVAAEFGHLKRLYRNYVEIVDAAISALAR